VSSLSDLLNSSESWESFAQSAHGQPHLARHVGALPHPAAPLLERFRETGVPVVSLDEPWPTSKVLQVAAKGAHKSARDHASFAQEKRWPILSRVVSSCACP
jgi:hypothetical protein